MCAGVRAAEWDEEERAGICGVERERVDTALCGADRRVDTRAEREHTFYRRVWRANWLPFALSKAPNSHTNTLLRTNIEGRSARCCAASARQRTLTHPASLSSPLDPHSVSTATRMFRTPQNPLHPVTHCIHPCHSPQRPSPSTLSYHGPEQAAAAHTYKRSGAHTASSTSQHRLSPRVTLPIPHVNQVTPPPVPESMFHLHLGRLCCGRGARLRRSLRHQLVRILLDEHLQVWWVGRQGMREICEVV